MLYLIHGHTEDDSLEDANDINKKGHILKFIKGKPSFKKNRRDRGPGTLWLVVLCGAPEFLETFTFNKDFILGKSSDYKKKNLPPSFVADEGQN